MSSPFSKEPKAGLAYVQSRISSPSLSPETYRKWYEEAHIPDVLRACAPNIVSAHRFHSSDTAKTDYPYLTLYPVRDTAWLRTDDCSFFRVDLHHELLPGPSDSPERGFIFDVARFDFRFYERVGRVGEYVGVPQFIVVKQLDDSDIKQKGDDGLDEHGLQDRILSQSRAAIAEGSKSKPVCSTLYKLDFVPPRPKKEGHNSQDAESVPGPAKCLVIHEYEEAPKEGVVAADDSALEFSLLSTFGDSRGEW
ncbi:hypothetical protein B0T19DRAFT_457059 [Cercophora scortea]|uniref:EthD domain-containing protein n=1 Tax=Cercophora scortea TaxID=314031 RepID=A0AAE0MH76_9PEZI|nr:hypothetical protein B0T19DRAFT_457059 [Cercophora scortea]